mmetsp:Transcript_9365/g.17547  ORF Transcript_9365/g.17547 Transcript_9365/m.17547 type:complete len:471 (-) Transcript_9365:175-1587(-)|eukprot:CAMPEP_0175052866 /NCGR_PEP_ID=MMETSP0052_2-20121109/8598_1 /TAXON_ID=51329 ORGANISM="Polytomella parva, Strain SAG 63-3" /NCGR_SAMPLE_ID=MMETSP0052_2 /ASSEMBLY_ACC=CAM_ASM_000194 /LENGTH=470 /DNA_ID=CAMNT_0016317319 /DNA_START=45 /DNA_END=1457 /DNA_ORIENTATION=+
MYLLQHHPINNSSSSSNKSQSNNLIKLLNDIKHTSELKAPNNNSTSPSIHSLYKQRSCIYSQRLVISYNLQPSHGHRNTHDSINQDNRVRKESKIISDGEAELLNATNPYEALLIPPPAAASDSLHADLIGPEAESRISSSSTLRSGIDTRKPQSPISSEETLTESLRQKLSPPKEAIIMKHLSQPLPFSATSVQIKYEKFKHSRSERGAKAWLREQLRKLIHLAKKNDGTSTQSKRRFIAPYTLIPKDIYTAMFPLSGVAIGILLLHWIWPKALKGPSASGYIFTVHFPTCRGVKRGAAVRLRGAEVGAVAEIRPSWDRVDLDLRIYDPMVRIPRGSLFLLTQTGLVLETSLDILPSCPSLSSLPCNNVGKHIFLDELGRRKNERLQRRRIDEKEAFLHRNLMSKPRLSTEAELVRSNSGSMNKLISHIGEECCSSQEMFICPKDVIAGTLGGSTDEMMERTVKSLRVG